eukprot:15112503-Ditylum_brightwellii.AAC.1
MGLAEETTRGGIRGLYGRGGGLVGVAIIRPSLLIVVTKRGGVAACSNSEPRRVNLLREDLP